MKKTQTLIIAVLIIILIIIGVVTYFLQTPPEIEEVVEEPPIEEETPPGLIEEFEEIIAQLDTSEKLVEFINENFILEPREGDIAYSPEILFQKKKGGIQDFAVFYAYVLDYHQYEAGIIRYQFIANDKPSINTVVVFRDTDLPKYIYFDNKRANLFHHGWSFEELFQAEEKRLDIEITRFVVFYPNVFGLTPGDWIER